MCGVTKNVNDCYGVIGIHEAMEEKYKSYSRVKKLKPIQ